MSRMSGQGCYACPDRHIFDEMEISDKIRKALNLEKVVPADFVEYLQVRTNLQNLPAGH